jgi:diacylglycerol kinase (ATP)
MSKTGVIINPTSGGKNVKGIALAEKLRGAHNVSVRVLDDFSRLTPYMFEFAQAGVEDLYISSGDGTIQAIQTILAEKPIFKILPQLCLLPHGTTNLTAADLGFKYRKLDTQAAFISSNIAQDRRKRHTIRVINPAEGGTRHGMTLGVGAAAEATKYAQTAFNRKGVKGNFATIATMGGGFAKAIFTKPNLADPRRFDKPYNMKLAVSNVLQCEGPQLMLMATTLEKMFFNIKPFWGGKSGPIRLSVFPYPVPNLLRWIVPILYGSENRAVPKGALSFSTSQFRIETLHRFVIDGEFFYGPSSGPLHVETGPEFTFICG